LLLLVIKVMSAVDLHDEFRFVRNEVDDVWTDRRLPTKTCAVQAMRSHAVPDDSLGIGQIAPQRARMRANLFSQRPSRVRHGAGSGERAPSLPSPARGGGGESVLVAIVLGARRLITCSALPPGSGNPAAGSRSARASARPPRRRRAGRSCRT